MEAPARCPPPPTPAGAFNFYQTNHHIRVRSRPHSRQGLFPSCNVRHCDRSVVRYSLETFLEVSMRNLACLIATAFVLLATSSAQSQDFFGSISGNWMSGRNLDEPVWFTPTFDGYEAVVPFFSGQSRLSRSDGRAASNVKIESRAGQVCWYSVGTITSRNMTWTLRDGNGPGCPRSESFRRG
jgi:hypothetical protein